MIGRITVDARIVPIWMSQGLIAPEPWSPNYEGIATLGLANLGEIPIALYPGLRIAQIAFATVEGETRRPSKPQFKLSFEPRRGDIVIYD